MIDILMATHNGERYLREQLDSIINQSEQHWRLLIRDDNSSDGTRGILREYVNRFPDKITVLTGPAQTLGVVKNFSYLMSQAKAEYVMLCDQDDVWLPDKIEISFHKMMELETQYGNHSALLVYTDLSVVNSTLSIVANSFWKWKHINPRNQRKLKRMLVQNVVTGSTIMINWVQLQVSAPIPEGAIMHDWWIALANTTFGYSGFIPSPTVLYRQHDTNVIGAANHVGLTDIKTRRRRLGKLFEACVMQAEAWGGFAVNSEQQEIISCFVRLSRQPAMCKKLSMIANGFFFSGFARNIAFFLLA